MRSRSRTKLMERRYRAKPQPAVRIACWMECDGRWRLLHGHADRSKTPIGRLYNRRARLVRRFGLSPFRHYAA